MSFKSFLKEILGIRRSSTPINRNQQKSTVINTNQHQSTEINSYQQKEFGGYNVRDLQYARRMGQIEQIAADIEAIKEKLTGLDIKFDLRVPDKVLTEKRFDEEISATEDIFKEIDMIKSYIIELKGISNSHQSTPINRNQQLSTEINTNQQKELLERIQKSAENIETTMNEIGILKNLDSNKLSTEEISRIINLSRSRTNQILLNMERKGLIIRIRSGKKFLWAKTIPK